MSSFLPSEEEDAASQQTRWQVVDADDFYAEYHGHPVSQLEVVESGLRRRGSKESLIYLAGDSSLDNKYWISREEAAVNGYERLLAPAKCKSDVAFHVNRILAERSPRRACVNAAVEATSLNDRAKGHLLPQDRFIRDTIRNDDVLVVSVGGNDIALTPLLCTCVNVVPLLCAGACLGETLMDACACACPPDVYTPTRAYLDGGCCCCGLPGCVAGLLGWPPGLGYFVDLFGNRVRAYVARLVAKTKPRLVVVAMIYYLDVRGRGSWADAALKVLGYDCAPNLLQHAIRLVFEHGTKRIKLRGVTVLPFPLFDVLDGTETRDYVQRVEPSVQGGAKIASALAETILAAVEPQEAAAPGYHAMDHART